MKLIHYYGRLLRKSKIASSVRNFADFSRRLSFLLGQTRQVVCLLDLRGDALCLGKFDNSAFRKVMYAMTRLLKLIRSIINCGAFYILVGQ